MTGALYLKPARMPAKNAKPTSHIIPLLSLRCTIIPADGFISFEDRIAACLGQRRRSHSAMTDACDARLRKQDASTPPPRS